MLVASVDTPFSFLKHFFSLLSVGFFICILSIPFAVDAQSSIRGEDIFAMDAQSSLKGEEFLFTGYWFVQFEEGAGTTEQLETVLRDNATIVEVYPSLGGVLVEMDSESDRQQLLERDNVAYLQRDFAYHLGQSGGPAQSSDDANQDLDTNGEGKVKIIVLDTGDHLTQVHDVIELNKDSSSVIQKKDLISPDGRRLSHASMVSGFTEAVQNDAGAAKIINLSAATEVGLPSELEAVIREANENNVPLVSIAGNRGGAASASSEDRLEVFGYDTAFFANTLGTIEEVTTVGAINADGNLEGYTSGIYSPTNHPDFYAAGDAPNGDQGTSFAAPRVTAAYAKIMGNEPDPGSYDLDGDGYWDGPELKQRLRDGIPNAEFPGIYDGEEIYQIVTNNIKEQGFEYNAESDEWINETTGERTSAQSFRPDLLPEEVIDAYSSGEFTKPNTDEESEAEETDDTDGSVAETGAADVPRDEDGNIIIEINQGNQDGGGLVPCDGPECNVCHFVQLGQNILEFLVKIGVAIAAIGFAVGGYYMVFSAGDTSKVGRARQIFTNVVIGLVILLAAWLIIDTVMKLLVDESKLEGYGPWNEFTCG